jgi:hypothetical protein
VRKLKLVAVLAGVALPLVAWGQAAGIDTAKQFFAQFVALENAHDPALADLYADEAFIKTRRKMPMGNPQELTTPAAKYKAQLRQQMATTSAHGNRSAYRDVSYTPEGSFVRIEALRVSEPSGTASPVSLMVGPSRGGKWLIYEALSESGQ